MPLVSLMRAGSKFARLKLKDVVGGVTAAFSISIWSAVSISLAAAFIYPVVSQAAGSSAVPSAPPLDQHQLIRRMAVFPFVAPEELAAPADEAWWQAREELVKSRRFLVASKQFLIKADSFQPRGALNPAEAIFLGNLLDAHALVTGRVEGRKVVMTAYDASNGLTLWQLEYALHPSIAVRDQLPAAARKLADDFIASTPYQAYQIVDPTIGRALYQDGDKKLAQMDIGVSSTAEIGDPVQWIRVEQENLKPVFQGGAKLVVFAEGKIVKIEQGLATAEVLRLERGASIKEYALIRLPREAERLAREFAYQPGARPGGVASLRSLESAPMQNIVKERRPLAVVASFAGSIVAILLLAF